MKSHRARVGVACYVVASAMPAFELRHWLWTTAFFVIFGLGCWLVYHAGMAGEL